LIENITVRFAGDVSPLLPPIVFECLSPFLSWRFDRFGEGHFVKGNQVVAERLVADGQEEGSEGLLVVGEDRAPEECIEII